MSLGDILIKDPESFRQECMQQSARTTISYFGIDLIIDRTGEIHLIEINGGYSGTKGFEDAYGEDFARKRAIKLMASFGLPVKIYAHSWNVAEDAWAEEVGVEVVDLEKARLDSVKLAMYQAGFSPSPSISDKEYGRIYRSLSEEQIAVIDSNFFPIMNENFGLINDMSPESKFKGLHSFESAEGLIWRNNSFEYLYDENRFLVVNPFLIESATTNKYIAKKFFYPGLSNFLALQPSCFNAENKELQKYFDQNRSGRVIIKPLFGKCGQGVAVLNRRDLVNAQGWLKLELPEYLSKPDKHFSDPDLVSQLKNLEQESGILIEPFIESKPFTSPKTGKEHRGAIRSVAMVVSNQRKLYVHYLGSYVRLAPEPISDSLNANVVNLFRGAHAAPLSPRDQNRLEKWVNLHLPFFYRRALRLEPCLGYNVGNCVFVEEFDRYYNSPWTWDR